MQVVLPLPSHVEQAQTGNQPLAACCVFLAKQLYWWLPGSGDMCVCVCPAFKLWLGMLNIGLERAVAPRNSLGASMLLDLHSMRITPPAQVASRPQHRDNGSRVCTSSWLGGRWANCQSDLGKRPCNASAEVERGRCHENSRISGFF